MSYENAYPVKPTSMDIDRNNKENTPPLQQQTATKSQTSKSSRALHVLSSITHSFSRSSLSLASFKSNRNFSGTSGASSIASAEQKTPKESTSSSSMRRPLIPRFDTQSTTETTLPEPTKATTPSSQPAEPDKITNERAEPIELDPKLIYTAQPSAYWTGRFTTLRDKYHSELLEPETLQIVLEEHMRRSNIEEHLMAQTTADPRKTPTTVRTSFSGAPSLPCRSILKPTPRRQQPSTLCAPFSSRPPLSSGLSRIAITTKPALPRRQSYDLPPSSFSSSRAAAGNMAPPPPPTLASASIVSSPSFPHISSSTTASQRRQAILLTSDDARRVRVFATLDALCATPAARESLRLWQTAYARLVGKECLLPAGESLVAGEGESGGKMSWGRRKSLTAAAAATTTWKREGSVASSGGGGGTAEKGMGWGGRLRMFSGGRRSQIAALEMGRVEGGSLVGGSVGGFGVASEPGRVPGWFGDGQGREEEGTVRRMRVKRIGKG